MHDAPQIEQPDGEPRQYAPQGWEPAPAPPRRERRPSLLWRAPVSLTILGICVVVFIVFNVVRPFLLRPGLQAEYPGLSPYQIDALSLNLAIQPLTFSPANGQLLPGVISHMFAHGDLGHLLVNMIVLFFLGIIVEIRYGTVHYLLLYFASGLIAAFSQAVFAPAGFLLGASGALAGVMGAFVRHYPRERLYLYGILPMPAWLLLTGWMVFNIYGASAGAGANIAFVAHIAGFVAGIILSLLIEPPGRKPKGQPWPARRSK